MVSDSSDSKKLLAKGAMRKLAPYNPKQNHPTTRMHLQAWQSNASKDTRRQIPPMDPDAKMRALHKLTGHTQVRRNQETGEREFLLHRGHSKQEAEANTTAGGTHYHYKDAKQSWTPNYRVASSFGDMYSKPGDPIGGHIASAWVPESAIHMVPKQLGLVVRPEQTMSRQRGPNEYAHEHEIIVNPGHLLPKAHPVEVEQAKNESFGNVKTLQQRLQDKFGAPQAGEQFVPSWMKKSEEFGKLAKMYALKKGAMRKLAPWNPRAQENKEYADKVGKWQSSSVLPEEGARRDEIIQTHYRDRSQLPSEKMRALHKLSKLTRVRRNKEGFREFLLHRGMSDKEKKSSVEGRRVNHEKVTSWTPDWHTAKSFSDNYRTANPETRQWNEKNPMPVSAWVDERHIATMPKMVTGEKMDPDFTHEQEVLVHPNHNSNVLPDQELYATQRAGLDQKINAREPGTIVKQQDRNRSQSIAIKNALKKADPIMRVRQAEGQDWGRETKPRRATYDFSKLDNHQVRRIAPGLYHHTGEKRNVVFHVLSRSSTPGSRPLAAMAVGQTNSGDYLLDAHRAHGADKGKGYVNRLWDLVKDKHPEVKEVRVDHAHAQLPQWKDHHPDLYHDIIPDLPVKHLDSGVAGAQVVGKGGEPTVLIKPALTQMLSDHFKDGMPARHQHFLDPQFTTSHREAMFHHLADHVFRLGRFIPRTTAFKHPITGEPFSAMEWMKGTRPFTDETQVHHLQNSGDIHKLAIMDFVLGNNDRHKRNVLLDAHGDMKLIDHGLAFDYGNMAESKFPAYAKNLLDQGGRVPQKVHQWIQSLNPDRLVETMQARGAPSNVAEIAGKRLKAVREWSAKNVRTDSIPSGKLGEAYGKAKAYSLGKTPAEMDQEARVADQETELAEPKAPSGTAVTERR